MTFALAGFLTGIIGMLFRVGGGEIFIPLLIYVFGFSQHQAQGTSLAVLLPPIGLLAALRSMQGRVALESEPQGLWCWRASGRRLSSPTAVSEPGPGGSLLYAALRYVEGLGLIWRQRWAAYVTVIATAAFIPLEVVELTRRVSWPKLVVIAMNVAVVWYLVARLRIEWTSRPD